MPPSRIAPERFGRRALESNPATSAEAVVVRTACLEPGADAEISTVMSELAARLDRTTRRPPEFLSLHHASHWKPEALRAAAATLWPGVALHGGTSCCGVMSEGGTATVSGTGLGGFALWDRDGDFGSAARPIGDCPRSAALAATEAALEAAGRTGESPDLVWLTAAPGSEEAVLAGVEEIVGAGTPIIGGSAADNEIAGTWGCFDAEAAYGSGVAVSVLFPSRPVHIAFQNGYAPAGPIARVTEAQDRRIVSIDGRPAADVYAGWVGGPLADAVARARSGGSEVSILAESTFAPLGRSEGAVADVPMYLLAHPAAAHPDGSLSLFARVAAGETLHLMQGSADSLVARAGRVARSAAESAAPGEPIAGALTVYCGGCMLAVRPRMAEVVAGISEGLSNAPFFGLFSFGEQGPGPSGGSRHGNLMISTVVFSA
ncbi:MAG: FIST signal transduction protein [Pikeienuella sp.]